MRILRLFGAAKMAWFRAIPLLRDARVPGLLKWGSAAIALVIISPLDLFSDIPVLGVFDDAALLTALAAGFVALATRHTIKLVHPINESSAL